jgi:anti-sigma factor RsiW
VNHPGDLLSAYLDGELAAADRAAIAEHLSSCIACRAEIDDVAAGRAAVRGLPMLELPPELIPSAAPVADLAERRRRRRLPVWAASAAAAAAVVAGLVVFGGDHPSPAQDLDMYADRHIARVVVDPGISTVRGPAVGP